MPEGNPNIVVEITDLGEFHCFRLLLNPEGHHPGCPATANPDNICLCPAGGEGARIEIMLHARSLVDLIHKCSSALCDWQKATTDFLLEQRGVYSVTER